MKILKKTKNLQHTRLYIIGFLDQTSCQDSPNSPRTLNKKGTKNKIKKSGKKFKQTAMGFQAINGESIVTFPENSRTPNMMKFMAEIRCKNIKNTKLIPQIQNAINNENLDEKNIKKELDKELLNKEELSKNIQNKLSDNKIETKEDLINSINRDFNKADKEDKLKIQKFAQKQLIQNLEENKLKSKLANETPIVIVLDNYRPHRNQDLKKVCKILNIILVHLPPYSPQLNPIEQVWKSIKRIIYTTFVETKEELIALFKKEYHKIIKNSSFYDKWVSRFILKS